MNRYKYMTESNNVVDSEDLEIYPDPLSLNYAEYKQIKTPVETYFTQQILNKLWIYILNMYLSFEIEDTILAINQIPYLGFVHLENDPILILPDSDELLKFLNSRSVSQKRYE